MNRENILRVADAIENGELVKRGIGFNMAYYMDYATHRTPDRIDSCGTTACIAGWTFAIFRPDTDPDFVINGSGPSIGRTAADLLGLTPDQRSALFTPDDFGEEEEWTNITPAHAVAVLRHLAETGKVDWSVGAP